MNDVTKCRLSDEGAAKRDAILENATAAMVKHHRTRRRKRVAIATAGMIVLVSGGVVVSMQMTETTATPGRVEYIVKVPIAVNELVQEPEEAYDSTAVEWRIVRSDSNIADQYKVRTASLVERIDNAELAQALNAIDRPAGVISIDGHVRLTQNVVDEKTALDEGAPSSM